MDLSALLLFGLTLIVAFVAVRIGAIAFELTGIHWDQALFQAISCFTGTGYTTREAELVTEHPQRRRIAATLMILGNASWVTIVVAFGTYLNQRLREGAAGQVTIHVLGADFLVKTTTLQVGKILSVLVVAYLLYRFFVNTWIWGWLTSFIRMRMKARGIITPLAFEDVMIGKKGYGILKLRISETSKLCGRTLLESGLRTEHDLQVLAIERDHDLIPNPGAYEQLRAGDEILCFGRRLDDREKLRQLI